MEYCDLKRDKATGKSKVSVTEKSESRKSESITSRGRREGRT
jgi:hypothetical protein